MTSPAARSVRDYRWYKHRRDLATRRRRQDVRDRAVLGALALAAQDQYAKADRPHFAVVTASAAFRAGWDRTFRGGPA